MPFEQINDEDWIKLFRRTMLIGPPNSWKTSALSTWPHEKGKLAIIQCPGELGGGSTPQGPNIINFKFTIDPTRSPVGLATMETRNLIIALISGKYGEIETLALDGLHKIYDSYYALNLANLIERFPKADELDLRGRAYGLTNADLRGLIQLVSQSPIPYVVVTAWTGREKDNKEDSKSPSHIWPDFPGTMAQNILGEFGCVLFSEAGKELGPGKFSAGQWQTRPMGAVWGVGLKVPKEIATAIPTFVPQDWRKLEARVMEAWQKVHTQPKGDN